MKRLLVSLFIPLAASLSVVACDDDTSAPHDTVDSGPAPGTDSGPGPGPDSGPGPGTDGGPGPGADGGPSDGGPQPDDCVMNPHTHIEILNACTDAARVDKHPNLPLLLADGGLPMLP